MKAFQVMFLAGGHWSLRVWSSESWLWFDAEQIRAAGPSDSRPSAHSSSLPLIWHDGRPTDPSLWKQTGETASFLIPSDPVEPRKAADGASNCLISPSASPTRTRAQVEPIWRLQKTALHPSPWFDCVSSVQLITPVDVRDTEHRMKPWEPLIILWGCESKTAAMVWCFIHMQKCRLSWTYKWNLGFDIYFRLA